MPRCVGKIERGPLHYTYLWKVAQGLTARPVKFGTIVPDLIGTSIGNDHYAKQEELLLRPRRRDARRAVELAGAGCADHPDGRAEHSSGRHPARRRRTQLGAEFFVDTFNRTVKGLRDPTEVWCHTCWGNPAQQRLFATNQS